MCPPGTDQTTRGPQQWHLIVPTLREKHAIYQPFVCHSNEDILYRRDHWVWQKLARPDPWSLKWRTGIQVSLRLPPQISPDPQSRSLIFTLPVEIISQTLSYLDRQSTLSFAVSCVACLHLTIPHIQQRVVANSAPWSNQPLACLGSYLNTLPAAFETNDIAFRSVKRGGDLRLKCDSSASPPIFGPESDPPHPLYGMYIARKYNWAALAEYSGVAADRWTRIVHTDSITAHCFPELQQWMSALEVVDHQTAQESTPSVLVPIGSLRRLLSIEQFYGSIRKINTENSQRQGDLLQNHAKFRKSVDSTVWYLRNHDTKELIRLVWYYEDFVMRLAEKPFAQVTQRRLVGVLDSPKCRSHDSSMTIERAMAVRTYWPDPCGNKPGLDPDKTLEQRRQSWAGHRFDVVTSKMHDREHESAFPTSDQTEWTDATEDSVKLIRDFVWGYN